MGFAQRTCTVNDELKISGIIKYQLWSMVRITGGWYRWLLGDFPKEDPQ